jgi:hypothetical protein
LIPPFFLLRHLLLLLLLQLLSSLFCSFISHLLRFSLYPARTHIIPPQAIWRCCCCCFFLLFLRDFFWGCCFLVSLPL